MLSQSIMRALQVYAIAIAISMLVAVLIKVLVKLTSHVNRPTVVTKPDSSAPPPLPAISTGISPEVVAAISAALAVMTGPHRILHITESKRTWASQGRNAQHAHQPTRH